MILASVSEVKLDGCDALVWMHSDTETQDVRVVSVEFRANPEWRGVTARAIRTLRVEKVRQDELRSRGWRPALEE